MTLRHRLQESHHLVTVTDWSEKFEKQIHRIYALIEQPGSVVTWDEKIPDPDNPKQSRQIDITIRRDGKLTLVECRIHKDRQDVQWIEELVGRRLSLRADAVIAVSNSGFTEGAESKARTFGIILRDLQTLTDEEIQAWGCSTRLHLTFFQYKNPEITLVTDSMSSFPPTQKVLEEDVAFPNVLYQIFETAGNTLQRMDQAHSGVPIECDMAIANATVCGAIIRAARLVADFKILHQVVKIPSVVAYAAPDVPKSARDIYIEKVEDGTFEITQTADKIFVACDLTPIKCPPYSQFKYVTFDFGRPVLIAGYDVLAPPRLHMPLKKWRLKLFVKQ